MNNSRGNPISKKVNGTQTSAAEYDECGNIKKLIDNIKGICYNYNYNSNGKIIKIEERNVSTNVLVNTRTFTYDSCQRTLSASNTATGAVTTHSFLYSSLAWKDQLVCYDGNCITYDAIGNPTVYRGKPMTWSNVLPTEKRDN